MKNNLLYKLATYLKNANVTDYPVFINNEPYNVDQFVLLTNNDVTINDTQLFEEYNISVFIILTENKKDDVLFPLRKIFRYINKLGSYVIDDDNQVYVKDTFGFRIFRDAKQRKIGTFDILVTKRINWTA